MVMKPAITEVQQLKVNAAGGFQPWLYIKVAILFHWLIETREYQVAKQQQDVAEALTAWVAAPAIYTVHM